jgi:hypothetical protein
MSAPEDFLRRWSRRKRAATDPVPVDAPPVDAPPAGAPVDGAAAATETEPALPAVDLARLPSIESITATTDVSGFLAPGVPPDMTRAALRRAWVADPAIRDFVGIAENQWDFAAPDGIPGFGPLTGEIVQRLVAEVMDAPAPAVAETAADPAPLPAPAPPAPGSTAEAALPTAGSVVDQDAVPVTSNDLINIAAQRDDRDVAPPVAAGRRSHGGALPK